MSAWTWRGRRNTTTLYAVALFPDCSPMCNVLGMGVDSLGLSKCQKYFENHFEMDFESVSMYRVVQEKGTVLLSTSLGWPAVAGCSRAETFSQLSSISFPQPCSVQENLENGQLNHSRKRLFKSDLESLSELRPSTISYLRLTYSTRRRPTLQRRTGWTRCSRGSSAASSSSSGPSSSTPSSSSRWRDEGGDLKYPWCVMNRDDSFNWFRRVFVYIFVKTWVPTIHFIWELSTLNSFQQVNRLLNRIFLQLFLNNSFFITSLNLTQIWTFCTIFIMFCPIFMSNDIS